ncbi:unnamed protein product, partial [Urochloa humidicola]
PTTKSPSSPDSHRAPRPLARALSARARERSFQKLGFGASMGAPGEARPWSRPPRWLVKAAVAAAERCGPFSCAADAVVRCFGAALLVRSYAPRTAPYLALWIGGEEGCAVVLLACAAAPSRCSSCRRLGAH